MSIPTLLLRIKEVRMANDKFRAEALVLLKALDEKLELLDQKLTALTLVAGTAAPLNDAQVEELGATASASEQRASEQPASEKVINVTTLKRSR